MSRVHGALSTTALQVSRAGQRQRALTLSLSHGFPSRPVRTRNPRPQHGRRWPRQGRSTGRRRAACPRGGRRRSAPPASSSASSSSTGSHSLPLPPKSAAPLGFLALSRPYPPESLFLATICCNVRRFCGGVSGDFRAASFAGIGQFPNHPIAQTR
jgi:hypothetical protein